MSLITMSRLGHYGRWGNALIEYAFIRTYAKRFNLDYQVAPWAGRHIFSACDNDLPVTTALPPQQERYENNDDQRPPIAPANGEFHNHDFLGWAQYHTSWYAPDWVFIQALFASLRMGMACRMVSALDAWHSSGEAKIGVHIRRGDFGRGVFYLTPVSWYLKWLEEHWDRFQNPVLFIASEDPKVLPQFRAYSPITAQNLGIQWNRHVPPDYNPLPEDVASANPRGLDFFPDWWLLKHCDVVLTPNSTYSFTAAWLNPTLLECWRSRLTTQQFERIDPWNCEMQWKENLDDHPGIPGTQLDDSPYWTGGPKPKHKAVMEDV